MFFLLATTNTLAFYFQSRVQGISTIHRNALFIVLWVAREGQGSKKQMIWTQVEAV